MGAEVSKCAGLLGEHCDAVVAQVAGLCDVATWTPQQKVIAFGAAAGFGIGALIAVADGAMQTRRVTGPKVNELDQSALLSLKNPKTPSGLGGMILAATGMTRAYNYVWASARVLSHFWKTIYEFGEIHPTLPSGVLWAGALISSQTPGKSSRFALGRDFKEKINNRFLRLDAEMRARLPNCKFEPLMIASQAWRLVWAGACWRYGAKALPIGLIGQFLIAPMSFASGLLRYLTDVPIQDAHYVINFVVALLVKRWLPASLEYSITIDGRFCAAFLGLDMLATTLCHFSMSKYVPPSRLWKHIVYGTLNTKTYFLVVFGALQGLKVDVATVVLSGILMKLLYTGQMFGIHMLACYAIGYPSFGILDYVEHRTAHCPVIYTHAHKQHHYMHDTTPFDAHMYGTGMNEEWGLLMNDIVPSLLGAWTGRPIFPYCLNYFWIATSFGNKGCHGRTTEETKGNWADCDADNWHSDHHVLHTGNFANLTISWLDFYFGTQGKKTMGANGKFYTLCKPEEIPDDEEAQKLAAEATKPVIILCMDPAPEDHSFCGDGSNSN